ncbi:porin [Paraburkholderia elongata]|uniref:Porin n=1 Tax=Paraburkholderia elongata TaxID=2675747 RepID=A0A972NZS0_9BURK|nr:porin [Paraburkholderia elongata]
MFNHETFKLKLVAGAAGLMFAGMVQAQSSVTLYGVVDGGLLYTSKTLNSITGQNAGKQFSLIDSGASPSQFGIAGTEDLGDGLKAQFKLESGFSVATGAYNDSNGNQFGRQAWIALDGKFGNVKAGLQFSPFFLALYGSDPRQFSLFGSAVVNYVDNVIGTGIFNPNAVSYTTPNIAGFEGSVLYALGGEAGNFQAGRQYSASLKYDNGSLMINAAIYDGNSGGTGQTPVSTTIEFEGRTLGVAYKFGALTAKASFVNYKVTGSFNSNVYGGGLDYLALPVLDFNGGVWVTSDRNHTANHSLMAALGTQYFLSKRTTLYGQVGVVNNHGAMNTGLSINGALYGVQGTTAGVNLGIRHTF